jgi:hypothetical protein
MHRSFKILLSNKNDSGQQAHEPGQKSWGGGGVKKIHEILQQICENLEGWSKFVKKMPFFCHIFPFLAQNLF